MDAVGTNRDVPRSESARRTALGRALRTRDAPIFSVTVATHEQRLVETLVHLADTLVKDFEVIDLLYHLVEQAPELVDSDEAGLLLIDENGELQVVAVTTESVRLIELLQLHQREGPCWDAFESGAYVASTLSDQRALERWPSFVDSARNAGFEAVTALPMRLRERVLGGLNLFSKEAKVLESRDLMAAQALADVATIAILQHRAAEDSSLLVGQLQTALNSRVKIEQAKGVIAEKLSVGVDEAFVFLRRYARSSNSSLRQTAEEIVAGDLDPWVLQTQ